WSDNLVPGYVTKCSWQEDQTDARTVASQLGITFHTVNFEKEYAHYVLEDFFNEYEAGRTPNPDVLCNKFIKFGYLMDLLPQFGCDYLATGHYAKTENGRLLTAKDNSKDQTYFLYALARQQLMKVLFPLGDLLKSEVRTIAKQFGLATAAKKDSQGICFVGKISLEKFLETRISHVPGHVVTSDGQIVGQHKGLAFYTIGQRSGLGIAGKEPYYVAEKRMNDNTLVVGIGKSDPVLYKNECVIGNVSWTKELPGLPLRAEGKIRYRQPNQWLTMYQGEAGMLKVVFDQQQFAVTPGQSLVIYQGNTVLGGGVIQ
ncbi:MAG: tRNA 2-thiouridine(34) synthase MnmA, partial [bacterium]